MLSKYNAFGWFFERKKIAFLYSKAAFIKSLLTSLTDWLDFGCSAAIFVGDAFFKNLKSGEALISSCSNFKLKKWKQKSFLM